VVDPWKPATMLKGLGMVGTWLSLAARAVALNKDAYREIAANPYMSAPGLLIVLAAQAITTYFSPQESTLLTFAGGIAAWLISLIMLQIAIRLLRGKASFAATFRVAAFAHSALLLQLLFFVPVISPLARPLAYLLTLFGLWIGLGAAHGLRGWRTLLIPVIYILVIAVAVLFLGAAFQGLSFSLGTILSEFGLTP
jgi:hypothetical protein